VKRHRRLDRAQEAKKVSKKMGCGLDARCYQKHTRILEDQRAANQNIRISDTKT
jgi:hypothetical protein